jgi:hypothetical protein
MESEELKAAADAAFLFPYQISNLAQHEQFEPSNVGAAKRSTSSIIHDLFDEDFWLPHKIINILEWGSTNASS